MHLLLLLPNHGMVLDLFPTKVVKLQISQRLCLCTTKVVKLLPIFQAMAVYMANLCSRIGFLQLLATAAKHDMLHQVIFVANQVRLALLTKAVKLPRALTRSTRVVQREANMLIVRVILKIKNYVSLLRRLLILELL